MGPNLWTIISDLTERNRLLERTGGQRVAYPSCYLPTMQLAEQGKNGDLFLQRFARVVIDCGHVSHQPS